MEKFNCLFFIDDDYLTNYFHQVVAKEAEVAEELVFVEGAEEALAKLIEQKNSQQIPEIIFLDINMPEINGWEFLELYRERFGVKCSTIIVLTTSANPEDERKAREHEWIDDFLKKPLSVSVLHTIQDQFSGKSADRDVK